MSAPLQVNPGRDVSSPRPSSKAQRLGLRLLSDGDLDGLPDPSWLIAPILERGSLAVLYGQPGVGKSFIALDWALSIETGKPWCGRVVVPGKTLYIAAEGANGLKKRLKAWKAERNGGARVGTLFLPEPVQLIEVGAQDSLLRALQVEQASNCSLIVVDTLARCLVGGAENASEDMGRFVEACARLQRETGTAVLVIHHCTKKGLELRGSGVLAGAADTILFAKKTGSALTLECEKQKNAEEFKPISMNLISVKHCDSCVLAQRSGEVEGKPECKSHLRPTLAALAAAGKQGLTWSEWLTASHKAQGTFSKHIVQLTDGGFAKLENGRYYVTWSHCHSPLTLT